MITDYIANTGERHMDVAGTFRQQYPDYIITEIVEESVTDFETAPDWPDSRPNTVRVRFVVKADYWTPDGNHNERKVVYDVAGQGDLEIVAEEMRQHKD